MKHLVIDDLREFHRLDEEDIVVYARTSQDAIEQLGKGHDAFDCVWFDHDLSDSDTIAPVLAWLEERSFCGEMFSFVAYIQSSNPVGRDKIKAALTYIGVTTVMVEADDYFFVNETLDEVFSRWNS